jgi:hypothetical protein
MSRCCALLLGRCSSNKQALDKMSRDEFVNKGNYGLRNVLPPFLMSPKPPPTSYKSFRDPPGWGHPGLFPSTLKKVGERYVQCGCPTRVNGKYCRQSEMCTLIHRALDIWNTKCCFPPRRCTKRPSTKQPSSPICPTPDIFGLSDMFASCSSSH